MRPELEIWDLLTCILFGLDRTKVPLNVAEELSLLSPESLNYLVGRSNQSMVSGSLWARLHTEEPQVLSPSHSRLYRHRSCFGSSEKVSRRFGNAALEDIVFLKPHFRENIEEL